MLERELQNLLRPDCQLFHGSRGGLDGFPDPTRSRKRCDFGQGFYMQTDERSAKAWVVTDQDPVICAFTADLSWMADKMLVLGGLEWVCTVLHNRRRCQAFNGTELDKAMEGYLDGFDFVIGPIADDRLGAAIDLFAENALTDAGLFECLSEGVHGIQVVAKTELACSMLELSYENPIRGAEAGYIAEYKGRRIEQANRAFYRVQSKYKGVGRYLSELIEEGPACLDLRQRTADQKVLAFSGFASTQKQQPAVPANAPSIHKSR